MATARRSPKGEAARRNILAAAEALFATRGLHGTSSREIAAAIETPHASLLHHFPTKERLYSAVLEAIAAEVDHMLDLALAGKKPFAAKLKSLVLEFVAWTEEYPQRSHLLLREILDNPERLEHAERLHLKPFLTRFTEFIEQGQAEGAFLAVDPVLFVMHFCGAVSYFRAAIPTIQRILGKKRASALTTAHRREILALAERALLPGAAAAAKKKGAS